MTRRLTRSNAALRSVSGGGDSVRIDETSRAEPKRAEGRRAERNVQMRPLQWLIAVSCRLEAAVASAGERAREGTPGPARSRRHQFLMQIEPLRLTLLLGTKKIQTQLNGGNQSTIKQVPSTNRTWEPLHRLFPPPVYALERWTSPISVLPFVAEPSRAERSEAQGTWPNLT